MHHIMSWYYVKICFLPIQYQAVAEMQSTEFPTPLRDAECVSLLMAYELYRASQSEDKTTFLEWIACQLCSNNSERNPAYLFAVSSNILYIHMYMNVHIFNYLCRLCKHAYT